MKFDLSFEFPQNSSIMDLEKRINDINRFLKNHVDKTSNSRHFGIEIFSPNFAVDCCRRRSVQKFVRKTSYEKHYILGFFFFNSKKEEIGNLTILIDLGITLNKAIENDVKAISAIAATLLDTVTFSYTGSAIRVNITGDDTQGFLTKHLTYVLNEKEIP